MVRGEDSLVHDVPIDSSVAALTESIDKRLILRRKVGLLVGVPKCGTPP